MQRQTLCLATAIVLISTATSRDVRAGVIGWSAPQATTSSIDVSTNGTLVRAVNGGTASPTVNGVTFQAVIPEFQFNTANNAFLQGGTTGDAQFNQLLGQAAFNFNVTDPFQEVVDLGMFTAGTIYEVQIFYTEQRTNGTPALNTRTSIYGSTDGVAIGPTVELQGDPNQSPSSPFGQFAIGTFVADGSDPDLTVLAGRNNGAAQLNAYQVRAIGQVPEPSSLAMFLLAGLTTLVRRRRA